MVLLSDHKSSDGRCGCTLVPHLPDLCNCSIMRLYGVSVGLTQSCMIAGQPSPPSPLSL